ncbi:MAG: hypothetical protein ACTSSJ_04640 [Candidatus Odinarchaeia archaeon]
MEALSKVYYTKVILGIIMGIICGFTGLVGLIGFIIGISVMFATYPITVYLLKIKPEDVGSKKRLLTTGLPQYFLLWILVWSVIYTVTLVI